MMPREQCLERVWAFLPFKFPTNSTTAHGKCVSHVGMTQQIANLQRELSWSAPWYLKLQVMPLCARRSH